MRKKHAPAETVFLAATGREGPVVPVFLAWAAVVLLSYFRGRRAPLYEVVYVFDSLPPVWRMSSQAAWRHLGSITQLAALAAVLTALGRAVLKRLFGLTALNALELATFSYALGLGLLGYLMLVLAEAGALQRGLVLGVSGLFAAAALGLTVNCGSAARTAARDLRKSIFASGASWPAAGLVFLALGVYGFYALSPEIFYDSLVYHLGLPNLYRLEGRLVDAAGNLFSGMPMQVEMGYLWALIVGDEILAKLIHWSAGAVLALAMAGLGMRRRNPAAGWLAAAVFLCTPVAACNLVRSGVDLATSLWVFCAVYALALGLAREDAPASRPLLVLSALMAGFALGSKYTVWPLLLALPACLLILRCEPREVAAYAAVLVMCVAPWLLKNLRHHGNPIFPYLGSGNWRGLQADGWGRDWGAILRDGRRLLEVLGHPWFISINGATEFDHVGPVYLLGLPALFWLKAGSREAKAWLLALGALWLSWWPLSGMPRFFLPGLTLLSVWVALSAFELKTGWGRFGVVALLLLVCWSNFSAIALTMRGLGAAPCVLGAESKTDYLQKRQTSYSAPYLGASAWIDANAPKDARILMIGDGRGYYLKRPFVSYSPLDPDPFRQRLASSSSAESLYEALRREGITHLVVNASAFLNLNTPRPAAIDDAHLAVLSGFVERFAEPVFEDRDIPARRWTIVYRVDEGRVKNAAPSPLWFWYAREPERILAMLGPLS